MTVQILIESPSISPSITLAYSALQESDLVDLNPLANLKPREFPKEEPFDLFAFIALYLTYVLVLLVSFQFVFSCIAPF